MEGSELLPAGSDTDSLDLNSYEVTGEGDNSPPPGENDSEEPGAPASVGRGHWTRLVSVCTALRRTWFVKEFVMMIRLAVPVVSAFASCVG